MNAVVIEHVKVNELPEEWRERLHAREGSLVTVRIEQENEPTAARSAELAAGNDPAFGIWREREDMDDVEAYLRRLRSPRYPR